MEKLESMYETIERKAMMHDIVSVLAVAKINHERAIVLCERPKEYGTKYVVWYWYNGSFSSGDYLNDPAIAWGRFYQRHADCYPRGH